MNKHIFSKIRIGLILFLVGLETAMEHLSPLAWAYTLSHFITKLFKL